MAKIIRLELDEDSQLVQDLAQLADALGYKKGLSTVAEFVLTHYTPVALEGIQQLTKTPQARSIPPSTPKQPAGSRAAALRSFEV